jgi:membrane protease YdiL (CAAX protease family)
MTALATPVNYGKKRAMGGFFTWIRLAALIGLGLWLGWGAWVGKKLIDPPPPPAISWKALILFFGVLQTVCYTGGGWAMAVATLAGSMVLVRRFQLEWNWKRNPVPEIWWGWAAGLALAFPEQVGAWLNASWWETMGWPPRPNPALLRLLSSQDPGEIAELIFLICLVAPLVEELIYRGFLWPRLRQHFSGGVATGVSALLFAALHWQLDSFLPHFLAGLVLGELRRYTGSLTLCVSAHATVNAVTVAVLWAGRTS